MRRQQRRRHRNDKGRWHEAKHGGRRRRKKKRRNEKGSEKEEEEVKEEVEVECRRSGSDGWRIRRKGFCQRSYGRKQQEGAGGWGRSRSVRRRRGDRD
jgi:hypothetical protein